MTEYVAEKYVLLEDLLRLGAQDQWYEVVNGELVRMSPVGALHVFIVNNFYELVSPVVKRLKLGYLFTDGLIYILDATADKLKGTRVPDASFVRKASIPTDWDIRRPFPGAPDLAVEVVSPGDSSTETLAKVRDFLKWGTEEVWVIYPDQRELHRYLHDNTTVITYRAGDTIDVSAFFPDLTLRIADLFVVPNLEA